MRFMSILRTALIWGAVLVGLMLLGAGLIGWSVAGALGLVSGVLGAVLAGVFMGLTTLSFWIALRLQRGEQRPELFFGVVLGTFVVKLVVFLGGLIWLTNQSWLSPQVFAITAIVAVVGSLVVDVAAVIRGQRG